MTSQQAFGILGLDFTASEDDIDRRFKELAASSHPDKGGSDRDMSELNDARGVALREVRAQRSLVPVGTVNEIIRSTTALAKEHAQHQTLKDEYKRLCNTAYKLLVERPKSRRLRVTVFGGISAAALFVMRNLPAEFISGLDSSGWLSKSLTVSALAVACISGVAYWLLSRKIDRFDAEFEELTAHIAVKSRWAELFDNITIHWWVDEERTLPELEDNVKDWTDREHRGGPDGYSRWKQLAREIGPDRFAQLLVAKGLELGILSRREELEPNHPLKLKEYYFVAEKQPTSETA